MDGSDASELRPIAALNMDGVTPAEITSTAPEFRWVRPGDLLVDETYQRALRDRSVTLIRRIVARWDWARFKPPVVAETPRGLEVIDGQHTAIAAVSHGGIAQIPVMVVGAVGVAERASAFVGHNTERVAMTPMQAHVARLVAGDPDAKVVARVCAEAGVNLLKSPPSKGAFKPDDCVAIATLYRLVTTHGPRSAKKILSILAGTGRAPIADPELRAVERLLFDQEYVGLVSDESIRTAITDLGAGLKHEAKLFAATHRVKLALATTIVIFRRATRGKHRVSK